MPRSRLRTDGAEAAPDAPVGSDGSHAPATAGPAAPVGPAGLDGTRRPATAAGSESAPSSEDPAGSASGASRAGADDAQPGRQAADPSSSAAAAAIREAGDRDLVEHVAAGDGAALEALYDRHAPILYALSVKLLGDAAAAEEVVQDAFWQLWTKPGRYDPQRGTPRAFLVQIARSRALDRLRVAERRARLLEPTDELVDAVVADPAGPIDVPRAAVDVEAAIEVQRALERLSISQRRAVVLSYYYGMTHEEIAERLAEPVGTVKSRIRRGLLRLHRFLGPGGRSGGGS
jgi:RNA polymerase sigma-70 factor (ECF subfamily)